MAACMKNSECRGLGYHIMSNTERYVCKVRCSVSQRHAFAPEHSLQERLLTCAFLVRLATPAYER